MEIKEFKKILVQKFGDSKSIVTLKELTQRIAAISKVRVGKVESRTITEYAEISLKHIDNLGYITIADDYQGHEPANSASIGKQALNYHDLILPFRNSVYKIGLIKKHYENYPIVVGNNSMLRIEFEETKKEDTPLYVMNYLNIAFVREFIDSQRLLENTKDKKHVPQKTFLTVSILEELPIPMFIESNGKYRDYIHSRLTILDTLQAIKDKILFLEDDLHKLNFQEGEVNLSKSITFSSQTEATYLAANKLQKFEKLLDTICENDTLLAYKEIEGLMVH